MNDFNRRNRYVDSKPITEVGPEWARGCENCQCGIVLAPDILTHFPINEGRAVQAHEELILFCTCKAGHMHRQNCRKDYNALGMELRRLILEHIAAVSVPTVHGATS